MTDFELPEIVYHGTVSVHKESIESGIDINKGYKSVDFGQGFYTTPDYHQALNIALARTNAYNLRHKKGSVAYPMVITFHLDRESLNTYKGLIFEKADDRWKEFVFNNRVGIDFSVSKFYNKSGKYSYVYGFVADSNITEMVGSIREGRSSFGEFADKLKPLKSNSYVQLSFHSSEVVKLLEASLICVVTFPPLFFILLLLLEKPACVDISVKGFRVAVLAPLILIFTYATISNCRRRMNANSKAV